MPQLVLAAGILAPAHDCLHPDSLRLSLRLICYVCVVALLHLSLPDCT